MENKKIERWFFRCTHGCKKSWAVDLEPKTYPEYAITSRQYDYSITTACPHCSHVPQESKWCKGLVDGHKIMGKVQINRLVNISYAPPCDGRCTNAQGPSCDCQCGGKNHGSKKLVQLVRDAGPVPVSDGHNYVA